MTLLICPVRPGEDNEELRYALRSWQTNLIMGDLELWVVGNCPSWLAPDEFVPANFHDSVPHNVFENILLASDITADAGYEFALYMNDDFFCLDPVGSVLPVRRNITLADHLAMFGPNGNFMWWGRSLALTASWLAEAGFPHPWSYEVHRPLAASPRAMFQALSQWEFDPEQMVPQWRTVHGVLNEIEAYPVADVKMNSHSSGIGSPWISTSDQSWRRYAAMLSARFPTPSRWER